MQGGWGITPQARGAKPSQIRAHAGGKVRIGAQEGTGRWFANRKVSPVSARQEEAMPLYAYRCLQCGETFEQVEHIAEHDERTHPKCPRCEGEKVVQVFAPFFPQTAKKS